MNNLPVVNPEVATMTSSQFAEMTGRELKSINRTIREQFQEELVGAVIAPTMRENGQVSEYHLPELESIMLCAILDKSYLRKIAGFWKERKTAVVIPENFADALQLAADTQRKLQAAINTKAEIGSRREATSMNTASQAVKKANKLEIKLDLSKEYSSIKRMEIITGDKFNWRLLKSTSIALSKVIKKVPDSNYEEVNSYHYTVWQEAYGLEIV